MLKQAAVADRRQTPDRRQFGRRWTHMHGWICIEGRPRLSCMVQNFSETGALLEVANANQLPKRFMLAIDASSVRTGCEVMRQIPNGIGVKFMALDEMAQAIAADNAPSSTYEKLLALANAEHDLLESAEMMRGAVRAGR